MADSKGTLAVLTSGGDAPGMNAAVRATVMVGIAQGFEMVGVRHGYQGLCGGEFETLRPEDVLTALRDGGTLLGSARCLSFHEKATRDQARARMGDAGIEGLVVIGGNGSLTGALALSDPDESDAPPRVIGIPASIDNDIAMTGLAIGVDTAMNTIVDAIDKIADTASAHDRTFIIEVMGRDCGYLAMTSAVAGGADMVLFPEAARDDNQLVDSVVKAVKKVRSRQQKSKKVIAIKAEGVHLATDELKRRVDAELNSHHGGGGIETRVTVLGHVVRGGRPSAFDRLLGSRLGNVAARALADGETRKMVAWMPPVDLPDAVAQRSDVDPYCFLIDLPAALKATEELLAGQSPLARWRASVMGELEAVLLV